MSKIIKSLIAGIFIGISNVVPAVSGGTIACVLGVYEDMLLLPSLDVAGLRGKWSSVLSLYMGMAFGILAFSKLIHYIYEKFPIYISYFFVGVIFASIFFLYEEAKKDDAERRAGQGRAKVLVKFISFVLGLSFMLVMYVLKRVGASLPFYDGASLYPASFYIVLSLYCAVAAAGMIVPGVSGSFLLLLLGAYKTVIGAVANLQYKLLLFISLGVVFGAIISSKGITFLLEHFRSYTYAFILGLTAGSIIHIFPIVCQPFSGRLISALCILAGYVLVSIFLRFDSIRNIGGEKGNE